MVVLRVRVRPRARVRIRVRVRIGVRVRVAVWCHRARYSCSTPAMDETRPEVGTCDDAHTT